MEQQVKDALNEINIYLNKLIDAINTTTEFYRGGQEGKANELMINIIDGLSWVLEGVAGTLFIGEGQDNISQMNEYLNEMLSAFENSDYVLICDLLEYEILPSLKDYIDKILQILGG